MKTTLLSLFGLFLLGMAVVGFMSALRHHGDWLELAIAVAFAAGGIRSLRSAGKRMDSTKPPA